MREFETRQQIRDFAHQLDATSYILRRLKMPVHKLRDVIDGLQGAAGGRPAFELSFLSLARRLRHTGCDETAETYAQRKVAALDKEQHKAGRLLFTIKRGGGAEHRRTRYADHLTPAANWMMQQARTSELWAKHPGRAIEAFTDEAIEMLPLVEPEESGSMPNPLTDDEYISRNLSHLMTLADKNYLRLAEKGSDPVAHAEKIARLLVDRAKDVARLACPKSSHCPKEDIPFAEDEGVQICTPSKEVSKLDAALTYAGRGWRVFPCESKGKRPLIKEWQNRATTDAEQIRAWWRKWPKANVAILTGAASGIFALDVDPKSGGDAALGSLVEENGDLPITTEAATGGGGFHIIFKHPGSHIKTRVAALGEGLDVRGDGGYIIAPPSEHESGGLYEWLKVARLSDAPEWLLKRLTEERQTTKATSSVKTGSEAKSGAGIGHFITSGQRNDALFKVACAARGSGEDVEAAVFKVYEERCEKSPPMDETELRKIARSAMRYVPESEKRAAVVA